MVTDDGFEIDIAQIHYPGTVRTTLHNHNDYQPVKGDNNWQGAKSDSVGFSNKFKDNFSPIIMILVCYGHLTKLYLKWTESRLISL